MTNIDPHVGFAGQNAHIPVIARTEKSAWLLRADERRCLLFEKDFMTGVVRQLFLIHPLEAIVLSLFDGEHTESEVVDDTRTLLGWSRPEAARFVDGLATRYAQAISWAEVKEKRWHYAVRTFVMPASKVDLQTKRLYRPLHLYCHVTHACPRACIYCNVERAPVSRMLGLSRWNQLAEECSEIGMPWVFLSGGDPLAHPRILDIIRAFTSRGIVPNLSTKGMVSRALAKELKDAGMRCVQYSIDSLDPEMVLFLTRSLRAFDDAFESISNLIAAGVNVRTNSVLTRYNLAEFPLLLQALIKLGVKSLQGVHCETSFHLPHSRSLLVKPEDATTVMNQVEEIRREYPDCSIDYDGSPAPFDPSLNQRETSWAANCYMGKAALTVLPDGRVTLCSSFPMTDSLVVGDLSSQSILEVWNSPAMMLFVRPPRERFAGTACFTCERFDDCTARNDRCRSNCLKAFGSVFAPDPNCPMAPSGSSGAPA